MGISLSSSRPSSDSASPGVPPRRGGGLIGQRGGSGAAGARDGRAGWVGGRVRRRLRWVWVGVGVVLVCSLGFATLLVQAGRTVPVLVVARPVPAGAVMTARDVRVVRLGVRGTGAEVVRAAREGSVLGQVARVPLVRGELLAAGLVGGQAEFPPPGEALVPFAVEPGGVPAGLEAGEHVAVLPGPSDFTGAQPSDAGEGGSGSGAEVVGTVTHVAAASADGGSGGSVVTVLLDTAAVSRAAQIARPRLVVLSPTGREVP